MAGRRIVSILGNGLLVGAGILSVCLVAEGAVRLGYVMPSKGMDFFNLKASTYYYKHEDLGWLPRAGVFGSHEQPGSFTTTFHTNSRGLRDKEYALEKFPDRLRIVVLGDSFTWGWGVDDKEIYTEVIESMVKNSDVINLGVTAFNTKQEFEYLKMEGMLYGPDIVVLALCMNDIEDNLIPNMSSPASNNPKPRVSEESLFVRMKVFVATHSALYNFVVERVNTNKRLVHLLAGIGVKGELGEFEALDSSLKPSLKIYPPSLLLQWERLTRLLLEMQELLHERNIRFIVARIPALQAVDERVFKDTIAYTTYDPEDFEIDKPYRMLVEFARSNRIEIVNPLQEFREHHSQTKLFLERDMHFNKAGHRYFGRVIAEYINEGQAVR